MMGPKASLWVSPVMRPMMAKAKVMPIRMMKMMVEISQIRTKVGFFCLVPSSNKMLMTIPMTEVTIPTMVKL